jgi:phosphate transport system permease protein
VRSLATPTLAGNVLAPEDQLFDRDVRTHWRIGFDRVIGWVLPLLFVVAILPILDIVYYVSAQALPTFTWNVLLNTSVIQTETDGMAVPMISTFEILGLATALAAGLGILGGMATAEFLPDRTAGWVRMTTNMLAGTPSVALGYVGYFLFVLYLGWGYVMAAGVCTLAFFMIPYVFRTTDLAFSSVPRPIREAAYGSGAGPFQYIRRVGAPIAFPQILTGIFLAMAIGVGESAPIILTTAVSNILPPSVFSPATYLTVLIWQNFAQASPSLVHIAFQAAFLLIVIVLGLNVIVRLISDRYQKKLEGLYQ